MNKALSSSFSFLVAEGRDRFKVEPGTSIMERKRKNFPCGLPWDVLWEGNPWEGLCKGVETSGERSIIQSLSAASR